jgi:hypothetical protein
VRQTDSYNGTGLIRAADRGHVAVASLLEAPLHKLEPADENVNGSSDGRGTVAPELARVDGNASGDPPLRPRAEKKEGADSRDDDLETRPELLPIGQNSDGGAP